MNMKTQSCSHAGKSRSVRLSVRYVLVPTAANCRTSTTALTLNTLRTGDADLRFYITTVQEG